MKKPIGLYIHVPFCVTRCNYCHFYSTKYDKITADSYKSAVIRNVEAFGQAFPEKLAGFGAEPQKQFDTVFFGGGTPSLLYKEIAEILPHIPTAPNAEITVEANPCDVTQEMCAVLLESGVNRLSVGVQSLDDRILHRLGRRHNGATALKALECAFKSGFRNVSSDIMLGIPEQSVSDLLGTLKNLPQTEHLSAYIYEPHIQNGDLIADMYLETVRVAEKRGLKQYEISNFGTPCKHNLKYWRCEEYIGIGASAHSFYEGKRTAVTEDLRTFMDSPLQESYTVDGSPDLSTEKLMLGLRLTEGVKMSEYNINTGGIPGEYFTVTDGIFRLTPKGFLISNTIIGKILQNI